MSKAEVIDALIESALQEFSLRGYEGASLRDIASRAGVTLSTIHRYFGSKLKLFTAVHQRVWDELNIERNQRLEQALREQPPRIEAILRALIEPVVLRVFGNKEQRRVVDLLRYATIARHHVGPDIPLARGYNAISSKWLALIGQALPDLPADRLVWGFSFAVGSLYSWQLFDHLYDKLLPHDCELSSEEVTNMLTTFCSAGLRGLEASESERGRMRTSVHIPRLSESPPRI